MTYNSVVISSGHAKHVKGAVGLIDEVTEARKVVNALADDLRMRGVDVKVFHDDTSTSQSQNLGTIVAYHNKCKRELDISVHFNAFQKTSKPMGTECLFLTQQDLAAKVSKAISYVGFINRGAKKRTDLSFLNNTTMPAILIETCFVDSEADVSLYHTRFDEIVASIADVIGGEEQGITTEPPPFDVEETEPPPSSVEIPRVDIEVTGEVMVFVNGRQVGAPAPDEPAPPSTGDALFHTTGRVSHFGGPDDKGVSADEGLAFIYEVDDAPQLFLPHQPEGSTGLARRLNPYVHYVACRWNYENTPKPSLLEDVALVRATKTGIAMKAFPADWGPHQKTGRVADISPGLMDDLGIDTDDTVEVIFPYRE